MHPHCDRRSCIICWNDSPRRQPNTAVEESLRDRIESLGETTVRQAEIIAAQQEIINAQARLIILLSEEE